MKNQGERQLEAISNYGATKELQKENQKAKELVDEVEKISRNNRNKKFVCFHSRGRPYDLNKFRDIRLFGNDIFNGHILTKQAKDEQDEMKEEIANLDDYNPINNRKIESKKEVLNNAKKLFEVKSNIIKAFEDGTFPLNKEKLHKEQTKEEEKEEEKEEAIPDWVKIDIYAFNNYVNNGCHSKVNKKSSTMNPVKDFLKNVVSGEFDNAHKSYLDNVSGDEQKNKKPKQSTRL